MDPQWDVEDSILDLNGDDFALPDFPSLEPEEFSFEAQGGGLSTVRLPRPSGNEQQPAPSDNLGGPLPPYPTQPLPQFSAQKPANQSNLLGQALSGFNVGSMMGSSPLIPPSLASGSTLSSSPPGNSVFGSTPSGSLSSSPTSSPPPGGRVKRGKKRGRGSSESDVEENVKKQRTANKESSAKYRAKRSRWMNQTKNEFPRLKAKEVELEVLKKMARQLGFGRHVAELKKQLKSELKKINQNIADVQRHAEENDEYYPIDTDSLAKQLIDHLGTSMDPPAAASHAQRDNGGHTRSQGAACCVALLLCMSVFFPQWSQQKQMHHATKWMGETGRKLLGFEEGSEEAQAAAIQLQANVAAAGFPQGFPQVKTEQFNTQITVPCETNPDIRSGEDTHEEDQGVLIMPLSSLKTDVRKALYQAYKLNADDSGVKEEGSPEMYAPRMPSSEQMAEMEDMANRHQHQHHSQPYPHSIPPLDDHSNSAPVPMANGQRPQGRPVIATFHKLPLCNASHVISELMRQTPKDQGGCAPSSAAVVYIEPEHDSSPYSPPPQSYNWPQGQGYVHGQPQGNVDPRYPPANGLHGNHPYHNAYDGASHGQVGGGPTRRWRGSSDANEQEGQRGSPSAAIN